MYIVPGEYVYIFHHFLSQIIYSDSIARNQIILQFLVDDDLNFYYY